MLRVDSQHEILYASLFTFIDFLIEMGGLYTSLHGIMFILFSYFTQKLYLTSLIRMLYTHEDNKMNDYVSNPSNREIVKNR